MLTTFVVEVEDRPGVLNRVASLFRRRGFNIESLAVGHTEKPGISRMTIVVETDEGGALLVEANLYKLMPVLSVDDVTRKQSLFRELAMIKVAADSKTRPVLLHLADVFRGRVVDITRDAMVIETTGSEHKIDKLVDLLRAYGILEMTRTGRIAMTRGSKAEESIAEYTKPGKEALTQSV
jgi:acetolactate synthase-1/3 small subunit